MSALRTRARVFLIRFRKWRRRRYLLRAYNNQRQQYYATSTRKYVASSLKVSIIVPCYNTPSTFFEDLLSSVFAQSFENWELILVDGSSSATISRHIKTRSGADTRIIYRKVKNAGIAANTNAGIAAATGDLIAFLDHDDTLDPDALAYAAEQFEAFPDTGLVYSDEDKSSSDGNRFQDPHFKPDFSIDLLRNVNYITHFVMVRTALVKKVGGISLGFDGAQDYDFLLRIVDTGAAVRHVPRILYHWRLSETSTAADFSNKKHITDAGAKALNEHYERVGVKNAHAEAIANRPGFYITNFGVAPAKRAIAVVLPSTTPKTIRDFIIKKFSSNRSVAENKIKVLSLTNLDKAAVGEFDSVMVVQDLVMPGNLNSPLIQVFGAAEQDGVDAVSPKIVSDGKIDDMGLVTIKDNLLMPLFLGAEDQEMNYFGSHEWVRNVTALTGNVYVMSKGALAKHLAAGTKHVEGHGGRLIVWSHIEMLGLASFAPDAPDRSHQVDYYNANLSANFTPVVQRQVAVSDIIREPEEVSTDAQ